MTNKPTSDASPSPAERQAQHRREEEANRRTLIQSQLRAKAVERLPRADFVSPEMMKWRHEKILQVMNQGLELVLGGMSVDDAVEAVFNETECAVSEKGA
jgi:type II secretory pathway component PulF